MIGAASLCVSFPAGKETSSSIPGLHLLVLDDRSRYAVALEQTGSTRGEAVRERLETV
jgi:hypothetical protein